jgi:5-dehydro-2-deoxygluconokinase
VPQTIAQSLVQLDSGTYDLITTGRVGVDLYPRTIGVPLAEVEAFDRYLGGSPTNVAVQAARLGSRAAVVTKVGDDGFGPFVRAALTRFGVDPRWVGTDRNLRTPIVFCEVHPPDRFPLLFYRHPKAPDMNLTLADFDRAATLATRLFWITGTGLCDEPSRSTLLTLIAERRASGGGATVLDLDYRPMFWPSAATAREWLGRALENVTIAVGNLDEVEVAVGERDPRRAAEALLERGVEIAVVKRGGEGVLAATAYEQLELEPIRIPVLNGLGAGDAFGGALSHALVHGLGLRSALELANAAGALAASRMACADDFGTPEELNALLKDGASASDEHNPIARNHCA